MHGESTIPLTRLALADMQNEALRTVIALIVSTVWSASMLAFFITDDVRPLEITTPIAALVVGRIMGYRISVKKNQEDS